MHSIERYGVVALIFLVVTVVAVLTWDRGDPERAVRAAPARQAPTAGIRVADAPARGGEDPLAERDAGETGLVTLRTRPRPLRRDLVADEPAGFVAPGPAAGERSDPDPRETAEDRGLLPVVDRGDEAPSVRRVTPPVDRDPAPRAIERPERRVYVVRTGDTLSEIALREVGTSKRWKAIVDLNPGLDPAKLKVGARLVLPTAAVSVPAVVARTDAGPAGERRSPERAPVAAASPASSARHVIRPGESLWLIAQRRLGDGERWREIAALNPGLRPEKLTVGKELVLPEDAPLVADARTARPERGREVPAPARTPGTAGSTAGRVR